MKRVEYCPICKGDSFSKFIKCRDHSVTQEVFMIEKCTSCKFMLTNPRPEDKNLQKYYLSTKYISHTNKKTGLFSWLYQKIRKITIRKKLRFLNHLAKNKGHILDIGSGTGEFLFACKKSNWQTTGVEPSKIARKQAIKNYSLTVSEKTSLSLFKEKSFNAITMWHVLEHIPSLSKTIVSLYKILKDDGVLIIAVPNINSFDASYYKEFWAAYDLPIHLWHFSQETIVKLFENHNFKFVRKKAMIFDSFYVSILSEEYKLGKKNFIKSVIVGLISNIYGFFGKRGYSSTIYVFKKQNKAF